MRRAWSALLAVVLGTTGGVLVASPAHAADANYPGIAGDLNLWDDTSYTDTSKAFQYGAADLHVFSFNDKASSVVNKTDNYWLLFDDTWFEDRAMCVAPHSHYSNLGSAGFNDKTSSLAPYLTCQGWPLIGIPN
jgi:hypothetical protein